MTEEYKEGLLKYLTGNLKEQEDVPFGVRIENNDTITNNLDTYLFNQFGSTYSIVGVLESEKYENYIIYGTRRINAATRGFLLIVDNNFNPIELITTYDSGTLLGRFYKLELDEKNQIYGIDYNPDTTEYRFIMLNNVFATSEAKLRQSYNLPNDISGLTTYQLTKDPTSANYLIAGIVFKGNINQPIVAKFTINVGSTNTWIYYDYAGTLLGAEGNLSNIYATWNEGIPDFKISAYSSNQVLVYKSWYYNDDTLIDVDLYDIGMTWQSTTIYNFTSIIADSDTIYYGVHATADGYEVLDLYEIDNGTQNYITSYPLSGSTSDDNIKFDLKVRNGSLFFTEIVPNESNYDVFAGIYKKDVTTSTMYLAENISVYKGLFSLINAFNLYQFNFQVQDTLYYLKVIYNPNINFVPVSTGYNNPDQFKPMTMSLYENDEILFNRNLYNLVLNGSTTTSTVEVPNTMLNNNTIDTELLLGNNSFEISNNLEEITTNEYETLHINIINTMSMINLDTNTLYPSGSARLNSSTNNVQDYDNAKCSKARINYTDDTTKIIDIEFYPLKNYYYTKFALYVDKAISSIDFVSNDENTIYNTITPTLTVGNIYIIKKDVYINTKETSTPVLYDSVQLQYNGEDVYY